MGDITSLGRERQRPPRRRAWRRGTEVVVDIGKEAEETIVVEPIIEPVVPKEKPSMPHAPEVAPKPKVEDFEPARARS